jgi:hypothetical protein
MDGMERHRERMKQMAADAPKGMVAALAEEARAICIEYGRASWPRGLGEEIGQKQLKKIAGKVRKVFASRAKPWQIYLMLRAVNLDYAFSYWRFKLKGDPRGMAGVLRKAGLPTGVSASVYQAVRRAGALSAPRSLGTEGEILKFIRAEQSRVGLAKAGFYLAGRALGGRLRVSMRDLAGKRKSLEVFPSYVRKLATRNGSAGGARVAQDKDRVSITIFSRVSYGPRALPAEDYSAATAEGRARYRRNVEATLKRTRQRIYR